MYFCSVSLLERTSGNNGHEIVVKVLHAHHIAYYSPQITDYSEVSNVNLLLTFKMHLKRAILASIKYYCSSQAPDCNCLMSTHVSKTMIPFMIFCGRQRQYFRRRLLFFWILFQRDSDTEAESQWSSLKELSILYEQLLKDVKRISSVSKLT